MTLEKNRCYSCGKLFCCSDCCIEHVRKKHPNLEPDCPLCRSERLAAKNFHNQKFLCHVVFHHLPLHCRVCGEKFENWEQLRSLGFCNPLGIIDLAVTQKSLLSPVTPSFASKTPCGSARITRAKEFIAENDRNGNYGNLISPPELTRNTSTPMNENFTDIKANIIFKTPKKSRNFILKTPETPSLMTSATNDQRDEITSDKENDEPLNATSFKDTLNFTCNETNYQSFSIIPEITGHSDRTPFRSILSKRSSIMSDSSSHPTRSLSNAEKKILDAMQELNENSRIENIVDKTRSVVVGTNETSDNRGKDSIKRVRFSDEFEIKTEIEAPIADDADATENEEFYEARQSMSEISMAVMEKLSIGSSVFVDPENAGNAKIEKTNDDDTTVGSSKISNSKIPTEASAGSSRVIMMVVVEKNGNVSTSDLVPLIDANLKKLLARSAETLVSSIESQNRENDEPRPSVLSVDSYMSVSSVERYEKSDSALSLTRNLRDRKSEIGSSASSTGGIFSAMAQAMRMAFRNFSGSNTSRNLSSEPVAQSQNLPRLSTIPESCAASSKVLTTIASALAPRNAKRSRDSDDLSPVRSSDDDNSERPDDARSPATKRPRGWYKIRGREPIARMRNNFVAAPCRVVISDAQRSRQDSLAVDDTNLILPSRVHQSTQTD